MVSGVYKITNPKGAIYIGSSKNIKHRWVLYKCPTGTIKQPKLNASLKKYGFANHFFEIIEECDPSIRLEREREWGLRLNVLHRKNLNCSLPQSGEDPAIHSNETKSKMSASQIRRCACPDEKARRSAAAKATFTGRKQSQKHIEKRKMVGEKNPMFGIRGHLHHNFGKIFSSEIRQKNSEAQLKKASDPNYLNGRSRSVINTETQEVFKTVKAAAESLGIKRGTLHAMLRGLNPNRTPIQYL